VTPAGAPPDGGFGEDHEDGIDGFGNGGMNTPPLIEAADTAPFFHNHSAETLEDAIRFYGSNTFADPPAGNGNRFAMTDDDVNAIGAFLWALSAMENMRYGNVIAEQAQRTLPRPEANARIRESPRTDQRCDRSAHRRPRRFLFRGGREPARGGKAGAAGARYRSRPQRNALLGQAIRLKQETSALMLD